MIWNKSVLTLVRNIHVYNYFFISPRQVATEEAPLPASKMEEPESPPPLPKGGYNIDWDNFDENINPFETKSKVSFDLIL